MFCEAQESVVKLKNSAVLLKIHVLFAERMPTMIFNLDGIER